ncbi:hypothetical protein [Tepidibacter hydrothermalis]|uniref:Uncharacterized protein n=1 Tax=Tepidibacter hydrothermalis TaxID=3036126 RepID=A0ABY8EHR0_9FIRM|nr:hypothetical protein [Tepidibacter hydrothermalis]WFD11395.1 hypothetical protein P4S50_04780 [Tepidibacter hydrothermalis]
MPFDKKDEYILSFQETLYFFYLENNILYFKKNKEEKEMEINEIAKDVRDFSAYMDNLGIIHIIIINFLGNLVHMRYEDNIWKENVVKDFDTKTYEFKKLKLYVYKDKVNILSLVRNKFENTEYKLMHYILYKDNIKCYKLINVLNDSCFKSYKTDIDRIGNIHLIYKTTDNKYNLFYRKFNLESNHWSLPERLTYKKENIENVFILCDTYDIINIIFFTKKNNGIKINYLYKKIEANINSNWKKAKSFQNIIGNYNNSTLIQIDKQIKLLWKQNNKFYFTYTKIGKGELSDIKSIDIKIDYDLIRSVYIGGSYKNLKNVKIPYIYRYPSDYIILIGIDKIIKNSYSSKVLFDKNLKNSGVAVTLEDIIELEQNVNIKYSLLEYINQIKHNFEKSDIALDLLPKKELKENINSKIKMLDNEIIYLKSKEENLITSLLEMKNNYLNLIENFKQLSIKYENLKNEVGQKGSVEQKEQINKKEEVEQKGFLKREMEYLKNILKIKKD